MRVAHACPEQQEHGEQKAASCADESYGFSRTFRRELTWAHTRKVAELKNTRNLDVYSLYGKLTQFDERIGMSFAWYFYGLHGNLVKSGQIERVLEAVEAGLIVLPEHDYRVLRRWGDAPYGF